MTTDTSAELVEVFKALSNPVRLQVLRWLRDPEDHFPVAEGIADPHEVGVCVSHIQAKVGLAQSTWGDLDTITAELHHHLDAGADHVGIQVLGTELGRTAMPRWRELAAALLPQRVGAEHW